MVAFCNSVLTINFHVLTVKYFNFDGSECLYCDILVYDTVYSGIRVLVCWRNAEENHFDTALNL